MCERLKEDCAKSFVSTGEAEHSVIGCRMLSYMFLWMEHPSGRYKWHTHLKNNYTSVLKGSKRFLGCKPSLCYLKLHTLKKSKINSNCSKS